VAPSRQLGRPGWLRRYFGRARLAGRWLFFLVYQRDPCKQFNPIQQQLSRSDMMSGHSAASAPGLACLVLQPEFVMVGWSRTPPTAVLGMADVPAFSLASLPEACE
jgi:hypothetical protein